MVAALLFYHWHLAGISPQRLRAGNRADGETEKQLRSKWGMSERFSGFLDVPKLINKFCFEEKYFSPVHCACRKVTHSLSFTCRVLSTRNIGHCSVRSTRNNNDSKDAHTEFEGQPYGGTQGCACNRPHIKALQSIALPQHLSPSRTYHGISSELSGHSLPNVLTQAIGPRTREASSRYDYFRNGQDTFNGRGEPRLSAYCEE